MPHISCKGNPITPFKEDRIKWNQDWEEDIAWSLRTPGARPIDLLRELYVHLATEESEAEMQHMLAFHRETYGQLCQSLPSLAHAVAVSFATNDFRKKWLAAQPSVRQEHILEALGRSCGEDDDSDFFRWLCDELTLPFLQKGGGQGFLDLLKHFTLDDYSLTPKEPIYLESSHWYLADPAAEPKAAYELADAEFNLERSYLIARTLYETLRSFLGISNEATKPFPRKRDVAKSGLPKVLRKFLAHEPAAMKRIRKQSRGYNTHPRVSLCENCGILESPGGERFMRCKACTEKVSRQIYYCSRECQRKDWKRHKIICGKPVTVSESHESAIPSPRPVPRASSTPELIGPPINGFKRSPALVYQVNLLNQNVSDEIDYLLITRTKRVFRFKIEDPGEKRAFRRFRDAALGTGDQQAVAAMGEFLVKGPGGAAGLLGGCALGGPVVQLGMERQDAFDQLTREFGFDVESAVSALERKRGDGLTWVEMELLSQG
ncbi:hypothetical protein C8F04DRAFT_1068045 [Mycena alexandri]|uniref:MYND-type domain-containing protein n=1 Tax=Mycena alexandri TaxID=1745969 RepID=A0AAD6XHA1_9AGAR|nr:hypothetical protein C8F04DRAFT_1068045 [Mycena alexandri]